MFLYDSYLYEVFFLKTFTQYKSNLFLGICTHAFKKLLLKTQFKSE